MSTHSVTQLHAPSADGRGGLLAELVEDPPPRVHETGGAQLLRCGLSSGDVGCGRTVGLATAQNKRAKRHFDPSTSLNGLGLVHCCRGRGCGVCGGRFSITAQQFPDSGLTQFHLKYISLNGDPAGDPPTLIPQAEATTIATRDASYLTDGATSRWVATADSSQCITSVTDPATPNASFDVVYTVIPTGTPENDCDVTEKFFSLE